MSAKPGKSPTNSSLDDHCPECGASVVGGEAACQALFDQVMEPALSSGRYTGPYRLGFDAYCMQHLERYCRSAKSYAAHLMGLCCGIEYAGELRVYQAIQKWLDGPKQLDKPGTPMDRGRLTVDSLVLARNPEHLIELIHVWAEEVWKAYTPQHELARARIRAALGMEKQREH